MEVKTPLFFSFLLTERVVYPQRVSQDVERRHPEPVLLPPPAYLDGVKPIAVAFLTLDGSLFLQTWCAHVVSGNSQPVTHRLTGTLFAKLGGREALGQVWL